MEWFSNEFVTLFFQFQCKTNFRYGYSFTWRNVSVTDKLFQIVERILKSNKMEKPFRFVSLLERICSIQSTNKQTSWFVEVPRPLKTSWHFVNYRKRIPTCLPTSRTGFSYYMHVLQIYMYPVHTCEEAKPCLPEPAEMVKIWSRTKRNKKC
jgi:hypothetical protein